MRHSDRTCPRPDCAVIIMPGLIVRRSTMRELRHSPVSGIAGSSHELQLVGYYHGASGSGGMAVAAAEMLWDRSLDRGFCYTTMVSDGASRTRTEMNVYGDDVTITKEQWGWG